MEIQSPYAMIVTRFAVTDRRHSVIILTDTAMLETAVLIQHHSMPFVRSISLINLDTDGDFSSIYDLSPDDLLILHIGIESWIARHNKLAFAFSKPPGVRARYICIRPTITKTALIEGLKTPLAVCQEISRRYGNLPIGKQIRVLAKSGTDINLVLHSKPWTIPFTAHDSGANAYLPPAEVSAEVQTFSANGIIVVDTTLGELRVRGELIDSFGLVEEPMTMKIENGSVVDIYGSAMAARLKAKLWQLTENCRRLVELGFGLSEMTACGIIGIDESIAGTCHFGFGSSKENEAPIHLDVVINGFTIVN